MKEAYVNCAVMLLCLRHAVEATAMVLSEQDEEQVITLVLL